MPVPLIWAITSPARSWPEVRVGAAPGITVMAPAGGSLGVGCRRIASVCPSTTAGQSWTAPGGAEVVDMEVEKDAGGGMGAQIYDGPPVRHVERQPAIGNPLLGSSRDRGRNAAHGRGRRCGADLV